MAGTKPDSGDSSSGETPLPIPNREVKPTSANGTAPGPGWESRSSPGLSSMKNSLPKYHRETIFLPKMGFSNNDQF